MVGQTKVRRRTQVCCQVPVKEYLKCVDEAWSLVEDGEVSSRTADLEFVDEALRMVDKSRRDGGYDLPTPQAKQPAHENAVQRRSSADESLLLALLKFCSRHGIKKEGWTDTADHPETSIGAKD